MIMKTKIVALVIAVVLILGLAVASGVFYSVTEMEYAIVKQFGRIVRVIEEPGLYVKTPFVQDVLYFDKRILEWDGETTQVPTLGKKFILVDTWARWRIADPERFYTSLTTEIKGHGVLDDNIESGVRDQISSLVLEETVRSSSNREMTFVGEYDEERDSVTKEIQVGRDNLVKTIQQKAAQDLMERYGIELIDVQIKRINYESGVRQDVYERMRSERDRIAAKLLSEAKSKQNEILGEMQRELETIESEGYKESRIIKGEADAKAAKIYADAYEQAPEFYSFFRTMESYEEALDRDTMLILSTDSDYFRYLVQTELKGGDGASK